jgi:(S)-sulfolactate dehydrogenase
MNKILITEFMDEAAVDDLRRDFEVYYDPNLVDKPEALLTRITDTDGLVVRNQTPVRGPLLEQARRLRVVGRLGVGLDNIDVAECEQRGITVCPATGANDAAVAEYVIATAMVLLRGCYGASAAVIAGDWPRQPCVGREIQGKTLGLVGFGGIARQTADRARALGMTVAAHDPFVAGDDAAWDGVNRLELEPMFASSATQPAGWSMRRCSRT